jgi:hypothetical protein
MQMLHSAMLRSPDTAALVCEALMDAALTPPLQPSAPMAATRAPPPRNVDTRPLATLGKLIVYIRRAGTKVMEQHVCASDVGKQGLLQGKGGRLDGEVAVKAGVSAASWTVEMLVATTLRRWMTKGKTKKSSCVLAFVMQPLFFWLVYSPAAECALDVLRICFHFVPWKGTRPPLVHGYLII